jgi:hypothetical protein
MNFICIEHRIMFNSNFLETIHDDIFTWSFYNCGEYLYELEKSI